MTYVCCEPPPPPPHLLPVPSTATRNNHHQPELTKWIDTSQPPQPPQSGSCPPDSSSRVPPPPLLTVQYKLTPLHSRNSILDPSLRSLPPLPLRPCCSPPLQDPNRPRRPQQTASSYPWQDRVRRRNGEDGAREDGVWKRHGGRG